MFKYALNYFVRYFCIVFTLIIVVPFFGHFFIFPTSKLYLVDGWIWIAMGGGGVLALIFTVFEVVAKRERDLFREKHPETDERDEE